MRREDGKTIAFLDASNKAATVLSERSPDEPAGSRQPTKKRSLSEQNDEWNELGDAISIHPCASGAGEPKILQPCKLIRRSELPLAYLSLDENFGSQVQLPLFAAYIWPLEKHHGSEEQGEVRILVTRCVAEGRLFAVERVRKSVYTLCALARWVSLDDFNQRLVKKARLASDSALQELEGASWWKAASTIIPHKPSEKEKPQLGPLLRLSMKSRRAAETEPRSWKQPAPEAAIAEPKRLLSSDTIPQSSSKPIPTAAAASHDAIGDLRVQYLETLYMSKAPLAYFVKGPLSRARVEYQSTNESSEKPNLVDILRTSILPVKDKENGARIDKKYTISLPELMEEIPPGVTEDDADGQLQVAFGERSKKWRKRKKVNPDGFFPGEEDYVVKWWIARETAEPQGSADDTRIKRIKTACAQQKPREMQLQIILILENLALDRQASDGGSSTGAGISESLESASQPSTKKDKKPVDMLKTLDVLLEKLQIWETTNQMVVDLYGDIVSAEETITKGKSRSSRGDECLRNFCTEVVVPFYAPRIPDIARSVCQKLGAAVPSPPKKPLARSLSSSKVVTKPGAPVRSRRPLTRILTEDNALARRPSPALSRSTTDSSLPVIKQELEDDTLSSASLRRQNLQQTQRYTQREVDLAAEAKATKAKLKRKTTIEQEIKGAIDMLKKPNARMAVKEFVDASDQRHLSKSNRHRKPQNPVYNPFALGVQVTATPKAVRSRRANLPQNRQSSPQLAEPLIPEIVPPSSDPRIPSSSIKAKSSSLNSAAAEPKSRLLTSTPSKSTSLPVPPQLQASIEATPTRPRSRSRTATLSRPPPHLTSMVEVSEPEEVEEHRVNAPASPELPRLRKTSASNGFRRPGLPSHSSAPPRTISSMTATSEGIGETPVKSTGRSLEADTSRIEGTPIKKGRGGIEAMVTESSPPSLLLPTTLLDKSGEKSNADGVDVAESPRQKHRDSRADDEAEKETDIYAALGWDGGYDAL